MKTIEFFFDFASPYAYLAHCRLPALANQYGYSVIYKPIDLFAAKQAAGNTGPASVQIPPKFRYVATDLMRWAKKYDVPFLMPWAGKPGASSEPPKKMDLPKGGVDSSRAHKGVFYARERGQEGEYVASVYQATFGSGKLVGNDDVLRAVVQELGWSNDEFFAYVLSDEADSLYAEANKEAQGRGVFGVPIMIVDDQMWWGNDRLSLLEEYLADNTER